MLSSPASTLWLAPIALGTALVYFIIQLNTRRLYLHDLPKPPHSRFWGHLKLMGKYMAKIAPSNYLQAAMTQMKQDFNLPDIWYLDLWPFGPEFVVLSGPDATAIPTTANAFPQADIVHGFFEANIGGDFIEASNGPLWKELHQMLAPGLTPGAVRGHYHGLLIDEAKRLFDRFRQHALAKDDATINLHYELGQFPFQVIWRVFFGESLDLQSSADANVYEDSRRLNELTGTAVYSNNPITKWQAKARSKTILDRLRRLIKDRVQTRFSALKLENGQAVTRANASNLLDRMLFVQVQNGLPLDDRLMSLVQQNAMGFLVAGYGTTTDTSSYMFMLLSAFPDVLTKLRDEHDRLLDKDFGKTMEILRDDPGRLKSLEYTAGVIQETLRMFPIGMVARQPPPGMTSFEYKGKTYPLRDHYFAIACHSMHFDPEIFDKPNEFRPERFMGTPNFPRSAYRPFERGLRSCMGQSLAMDEMTVMLVMTARWFDFELRDHQPGTEPRLGFTDLDTKIGNHAFQTAGFSAGPTGPVNMRIRLAGNVGR